MADLKKAIKEKQIEYVNVVYIAAYLLVVIKAYYSFSELIPRNYEQKIFTIFNVAIFAFVAYKLFFLQKYSIIQIFVLAFWGIASLYTDRTLGLFLMLLNYLFLVSTQDVDVKKTVGISYKVQALLIGIHVIAYPIFLIIQPWAVKYTYRNGDHSLARHQFLLQHSNTFSMLLLWTILGYLYAEYERLNKIKLIVCWLLYYFFYQFSDSNSGLIILSVTVFILFMKDIFGERVDRVVTFLAKYLYSILSIIFIYLMVSYTSLTGSAKEIWDNLDIFFTGRMKFGAYVYDKQGVTLFGRQLPIFTNKVLWYGHWLDGIANDQMYMFMAVEFGLAYLILLGFLFWKYSSMARFEEKVIIIAYSLYTMMELYVTYTYFCIAPIIIMQYVWKKPKKRENVRKA